MNEQQKKDFRVINGNSLDVLLTLEENSIDAIVTDPPYGLTSITKRFGKPNSAPCKDTKENGPFVRVSKGFMGKEWDGSGIEYNVELWKRALRVLKPGGYLLAFGGSRTFHRIACAIEDAGFEIRDTIIWLYGVGFPKSHNIGLEIDKLNGVESKIVGSYDAPDTKDIGKKNDNKLSFGQVENAARVQYQVKEAQNEYNGWGTALKPAFEPIIMARKPISEDSVAKNVLKYGTGGINIDECRVDTNDIRKGGSPIPKKSDIVGWTGKHETYTGGRFPANVITDGSDEVASGMPKTNGAGGSVPNVKVKGYGKNFGGETDYEKGNRIPYDSGSGSAMRYFYQAKATKKDRDEGLDMLNKLSYVLKKDTPKEIVEEIEKVLQKNKWC